MRATKDCPKCRGHCSVESEKTGKWIRCDRCSGTGTVTVKVRSPDNKTKNEIVHELMMRWPVPSSS